MARSMDIFVEADVPIQVFVKEVEMLLGIKLQRISDGEDVYYEFQNSPIIVTVGTHEFVNDRDMNFEDYRYHLSVWGIHIGDGAAPQKSRDEFACFIFHKLKASQRYRLMLVEDIQMKLEVFQQPMSAKVNQ